MKTTLITTLVLLTSTACATSHSALTMRHRESNGVGYNQGYSTLDYYLTSQWDRLEMLLNLRGHLFNDAKAAGNGGLGFRYSLNDDTSRLGANFYYDFRDAHHFVAQQVGSGLEWISKTVDVRVNGYVPVGKQRNFRDHRFQGFSGNQVLIRQKFTGALPCIEGEVGTSLANPFYFAVGSYYLFQETSHSMHIGNAWGWKARFDVDIRDYFTMGALVTHDRIFHTRIQGYVSLNIPLGPWKSMKDGSCKFEKRRIIRNEIIPIQSKKKSKTPLSSGSHEAGVTRFLFVNNTASPQGDGTFERPFASLKDAEASSQPGDVIYVFPGDGTPRNMDEGIILKENQVIASSGSPLEVNTVEIPAQTPGQNPTITNIHADEPVIQNPGKSELNNFYYMNPWEYMRLYHAPKYPYEPPIFNMDPPGSSSNTPSSPSAPPSPYTDPSLSDWVVVGPTTPPVSPTAPPSSASIQSGGGIIQMIADYTGIGRKDN